MKLFVILSLCTIVYATYTDTDETVDVDEIAKNPTEFRQYVDCFLNKQPCTKVMAAYKSHIKESVANDCKECTMTGKHMAEMFIKNLEAKFPDDLAKIKAMYDPDGTHFQEFEDVMAQY